jgi:hypothetical protein
MKKIIYFSLLTLITSQVLADNIPTRYVKDIEKISNQYNDEMRSFLKSLDPTLSEFQPHQKDQYCAIITKYADDFYKTTQKNKDSLPFSYSNMTKQDVVNKVLSSKEMELVKQYNIECDFK